MMWFLTLPIPYSCVLNPVWRVPQSSVALNFRQRRVSSMEKRCCILHLRERQCFWTQPAFKGHRTSSVHHISTGQCSLYVLLIELGLLAQGSSMDFLTKIKGRMLVCLYGIKRADVILNSWWLDDNQLLLLVTKHNKNVKTCLLHKDWDYMMYSVIVLKY